jgi:hypothetical protein
MARWWPSWNDRGGREGIGRQSGRCPGEGGQDEDVLWAGDAGQVSLDGRNGLEEIANGSRLHGLKLRRRKDTADVKAAPGPQCSSPPALLRKQELDCSRAKCPRRSGPLNGSAGCKPEDPRRWAAPSRSVIGSTKPGGSELGPSRWSVQLAVSRA